MPRPGLRLVAVAVLLALALASAGAVLALRHYHVHRDRELEQTAGLARAASADAERFLRDRIELLQAIARNPLVRASDVEGLRPYFADERNADPSIADLLWLDTHGVLRLHALPDAPGPPINLGDREYYRAVLSTGQPYVSAALVGRFSNRPVVVVAVPTRDAGGAVSGVLAAGITLEHLEDTLAEFSAGAGGSLLVVDRAGQLVTGSADAAAIVDVSAAPLLRLARDRGRGVIAGTTGVRGEPDRLVAFAPVPTGGWTMLADRSARAAFAPARRELLATLATLAAIAGAGLAGVVWAGARLGQLATGQQRALQGAIAENAERRRAEASLQLLAEAGAVLAASLEYEVMLEQITRLVVPRLADWCTVHTVEPGGEVRRTAMAHVDRRREQYLEEVRQRYPFSLDGSHPVARVIRSGEPLLFPVAGDDLFRSFAQDEGHVALLRGLIRSYMVVPLTARGRTLGALALVMSTSGRAYGPTDLALAEMLARRAALAIDNARLYEEAQAALQVREQFFTSISHDLRTPLTSISAYAQLLAKRAARGSLVDAGLSAEALAGISGAAAKMTGLIGELLDLSRLQTGRPLDLELQPTDLVALVRREAAAQQALSDRHTITVEAGAGELIGTWDISRLERVVANVLTNAVKYSPAGGTVQVSLAREEEGEGPAWAVLRVQDEGIGIPAADLPHIFERFHRGANVGRILGTGIGLPGARQIVEQHGGMMIVDSREGEGTTVTVRLPLSRGAGAPAPAAEEG